MSSGEIKEIKCQKIAKSRIQPDSLLMSSDVFSTPDLSSDAIVTNGEEKLTDDPDIVSLLIRALNKLAISEYNGIVEDIPAFVNVFNDRTAEYKLRLGQQAILYYAKKQKARGWK